MLIGLNSTGTNHGTLDQLVDEARAAEELGLSSVWVPNYFGMDALTCLATVGREVPRIRLGTAVVPIFTRHPFAMAQQALTVQAASGGRLTLGLGLSHRAIVEGAWGLSFDHPARMMQSYLEALASLIHPERSGSGGAVGVESAPVPPRVTGATGLDIVVAALGPRMVEIAGRLADGVVLYCVGTKGVADLVPRLTAAAAEASRPAPRVVVSLPVSVTADGDRARERIGARLAAVDELPSYRRSLDAEGVRGIADIALVGGCDEIRSSVLALIDAGVTEFTAMITGATDGERRETIDLLAELAADLRPDEPVSSAP